MYDVVCIGNFVADCISKTVDKIPEPGKLGLIDSLSLYTGDSFCAGFLYGITHDMTMAESARFANAVGAHCVMAVGASTGIKPYADICKFMEERKNA